MYDLHPQKFLRKLDRHIAVRIIDRIEMLLVNNPVPHDAKAIVGEHGVFRIRIGKYRALYRVDYGENKIVILKIDRRDSVYD